MVIERPSQALRATGEETRRGIRVHAGRPSQADIAAPTGEPL